MSPKQYISHMLAMYNRFDEFIGFDEISKNPHLYDEKCKEMKKSYKDYEEQGRSIFDVMEESSAETRAIMFKSLFQQMPNISEEDRITAARNMNSTIALYNWGKTKVVYDFNKEISDSIMESIGDDFCGITLQCLEFLPLQAFYMKLPSIPVSDSLKEYIKRIHRLPDSESSYFGAFPEDVTTEGAICYWEPESKRFYFSIEYSSDIYEGFPIVCDTSFDKEFLNKPVMDIVAEGCLNDDEVEEFSTKERRMAVYEGLRAIVPHLVYLTAENAEVPVFVEPTKEQSSKRPSMKNLRQGEVGRDYRIRRRKFRQKYASSRKSSLGGNGSMKAPHIRRAHYTRYWYGKRDSEERQMRLKWIPETYIHKEQMLDIKPTIVSMS